MTDGVKGRIELAAASHLPSLPKGMAGQFVGAVSNRVVVAGGTWWTAPPADGGRKVWTDHIFVLDTDSSQSSVAGRLPLELGYGAAIATGDSLILAGRPTSTGVSPFVLHLTLNREGRAEISLLPALSVPAANIAGALANGRIYVAGGQKTVDAGAAAGHFWSLEAHPPRRPDAWRVERTWPGPGGIRAPAVGRGDSLYLMGGASLHRNLDRSVTRKYPRDAFRFRPREGWKRIVDLPFPSVVAFAVYSSGAPLLLGGDHGSVAGVKLAPGEGHPGFNRSTLAYDAQTNRWQTGDNLPEALVTTGERWLMAAS